MEKLYFFLSGFLTDFYENRFQAYPQIVKIAYAGIFISFTVTSLCYLLVYFRRVNQAYIGSKTDKWKAEIENILTGSVIQFNSEDYQQEDITEIAENLRKLPMHKYIVRQIVVNELMFLHKNFSGKVNILISSVYLLIGLDKHSRRKLKSWRWYIKAEAIEELSEFGIHEIAPHFLKYVNSKNITLSMQAQSGYLQASKTDPFIFLDYANQNLILWHQINLMEILNRKKDIEIPAFSKWFTSKNNSVVIFCIRLMVKFNQTDCVKDLIKLAHHENEEVRKEMIAAFGDMSLVDYELHLTIHFRNETLPCKIEIIKTIGKIASNDELNFLKNLLLDPEFQIRFEAAKAIRKHGEKGEMILFDLLENLSVENRDVVLHVLDSKLSA